MSLLIDGMSEKKFDVRMVERGLSKNTIDPTEVDRLLKQLPDDSAYADYVSLESLADPKGTRKSAVRSDLTS